MQCKTFLRGGGEGWTSRFLLLFFCPEESRWRLETGRRICFAPWSTIYPDRHSTFQTKQVVFTRRDAAQPTSKNSKGYAKQERRHAPHASHRAQARRTRPSSSLPAPKQCSGNASRAQVNVNATGAPGGRLNQESHYHIPLVHLERVKFSLQWVCNEVCQARAQER